MKCLKIIFILSALMISFFSCQKNEDDECGQINCTLEFKIITVLVKDTNQNPVILDSYQVINKENNEDVTPSNYSDIDDGVYGLVTDGSIEKLESRELVFIGIKDSTEVIRKSYVAKEECCGVELVSGNRIIIL